MKSASALVFMMFSLSFTQLVIASHKDSAKSSQGTAGKKAAMYVFGMKIRKDSAVLKSCKGEPIGKHKKFPGVGKGSLDYASKLKGLSVGEALRKVEDTAFRDKAYLDNDNDEVLSFNGFYPDE